jgi:hypothetical protein
MANTTTTSSGTRSLTHRPVAVLHLTDGGYPPVSKSTVASVGLVVIRSFVPAFVNSPINVVRERHHYHDYM